jgi:hypothetical protein
MVYYKNFCKCHNVPPPSTTLKKSYKKSAIYMINKVINKKNVTSAMEEFFLLKHQLSSRSWGKIDISCLCTGSMNCDLMERISRSVWGRAQVQSDNHFSTSHFNWREFMKAVLQSYMAKVECGFIFCLLSWEMQLYITASFCSVSFIIHSSRVRKQCYRISLIISVCGSNSCCYFFFFLLFIYSHVHTLFGSFLLLAPASTLSPHPPSLPGRTCSALFSSSVEE